MLVELLGNYSEHGAAFLTRCVAEVGAGGVMRAGLTGQAAARRSLLFPFVVGAPVWTLVDGAISGAAVATRRGALATPAPPLAAPGFVHPRAAAAATARLRLQIKRRVRVGGGGGQTAPSSERCRRQTSGNKSPTNRPALHSRFSGPYPLCVFQSLFAQLA